MDSRLAQDIRLSGGFAGPEQEAYLNLQRTADVLLGQFARLFASHGISSSQYNALRILRGAGRAGLPCRDVGARMVSRAPDVTRLLDGLEKRGLVSRRREEEDRRVVIVRITPEGRSRLAKLDAPVARLHREQLSHLGEATLRRLSRLLERARETAEGARTAR
ncbi:MAG: MarR family winged helix-turn-helix transcriptional regulator [Planctomycetota bacterium]|jgi:DNA-binding MarR family transcriptional regulator